MPPQTPNAQTPQEYLREQARIAGVPEALALGVADQESSFNPLAVGQKEVDLGNGRKTRAYGMFQILPETAVQYGADPANPQKSVQDPVQNVQIGLRYLKALHDKYGGHLDQVLAAYGGVKTDPTYVPTATAKILQWQKTLEHEQAAGGPAVPGAGGAGAPEKPWAEAHPYLSGAIGALRWAMPSVDKGISAVQHLDPEKHPYLNAAIQSFDPNEREARQNYGGLVGGIGGAAVGGPVGSVVGAGVGGMAENAVIEETGYGDKIARFLPGEVNGPPPPPDSTPLSRTLEAGAWQAGGDLVGQGLGLAAKGIAKRVIQSRVAKTAFDHFATVKADAIDKLKTAVENLTETAAQQTAARNQAGRAATAAAQQDVRTAARAGAADVQAARAAKASTVAQAGDAADRSVRDAEARAAELFKRHQAQGAAGVAQVGADAAAGMPPRPPFVAAGQAVIDAVEGPARDAYRARPRGRHGRRAGHRRRGHHGAQGGSAAHRAAGAPAARDLVPPHRPGRRARGRTAGAADALADHRPVDGQAVRLPSPRRRRRSGRGWRRRAGAAGRRAERPGTRGAQEQPGDACDRAHPGRRRPGALQGRAPLEVPAPGGHPGHLRRGAARAGREHHHARGQ
jgi:hypothetical protein